MSDMPWVLAVGQPAPAEAIQAALQDLETFFGREIGALTDLGPEIGIDWAITMRAEGRLFRVLLPWAPYEDGDAGTVESLVDDAWAIDVVFEGDQQTWSRTPSGYASARNFAQWELIKLADLVIVFHDGTLSDRVAQMARCARYQLRTVWGFDLRDGSTTSWFENLGKRSPMKDGWPLSLIPQTV